MNGALSSPELIHSVCCPALFREQESTGRSNLPRQPNIHKGNDEIQRLPTHDRRGIELQRRIIPRIGISHRLFFPEAAADEL